LFGLKLHPQFDHRPALINGGQNRESMIEAVCAQCHLHRTGEDAKEKAERDLGEDRKWGIERAPTRHPVPGSKASKWAIRYNRETGRWETVRR
jgi:5-methylcytosine-specific restriction endonuclease McrA